MSGKEIIEFIIIFQILVDTALYIYFVELKWLILIQILLKQLVIMFHSHI